MKAMRAIEFIHDESLIEVTTEELKSINRGLRDFEEGKIHTNETAHKIYERYLSNLQSTYDEVSESHSVKNVLGN
ncbi:MAG: hypothetical protein A2066_16080 [Bacteroidetes bacterium GWB2_41_8]|nr:MAG: hypothetical protein A2066_16080 [Bacteroidetes bacterium GWB2_41_8]